MEKYTYFISKKTKIEGTLTLPDEVNNPPVCLFIGGSFPQTRDGNLDNSKKDWFPVTLPERNLFKDEAKLFEGLGYATFRYDKRGCGESEGNCDTVDLSDLVNDAREAIKWLKTLPEVDNNRIGILGQSEGAVIALMLASENLNLAFYIWQGGVYRNLEDILFWQRDNFWKLEQGAIENFKNTFPLMYWVYAQTDELWNKIKQGETNFKLGDETWSKDFYLPLWKQHYDHPPYEFISEIKCPVLLLHGELDHNTPYTEALLAEEALKQAGNSQVTTHIFPGLDHSFRRLGNPDEDFITAMKRPLDVQVTKAIRQWVKSDLEFRRYDL
ncbi:unknown [Crocosphaera subtropica ATCC 51142]|uniref:Xaa-Pro dipeptidyl-peptidase-like domain-containing protein n=1 Tax=Crocosphaera subtropica (strain ATCC 51142 / BH68) TaxID=43989 RepID=B1WZC8_CROS5|nr:alpha/beta fold hydrolase [Crocosphaera subtropica]ACB49494.1 unknown [Crocosphaera subtropica ATCC 51142]